MMAYTSTSTKIPWIDGEQWDRDIKKIQERGRITNIQYCIPEKTDTDRWYNIHYEHSV
jgi:hypothetical protein